MSPHVSAPVQLSPDLELGHLRLLDAEPDLAEGVDDDAVSRARRATVVPMQRVRPGPWEPEALRAPGELFGPFAVLVVDGLLTRDVVLADRVATQLIGSGDVLALNEPQETLPPTAQAWTAVNEVTLAILGARFLAAARHWPWLFSAVARRLGAWSDRGALLQAITQLGRVDLRVLAVLWHLADRWGKVGSEGVVLPMRLTHEALGRLVGAQRPTVTLALKELREAGLVTRPSGCWVLSDAGRALLELEPRRSLTPPHVRRPADYQAAIAETREMRSRAASARDVARARSDEGSLARPGLVRERRRGALRGITTE